MLRTIARHPNTFSDARATVAHDVRTRDARFLRHLAEMVWPFPASPVRRLLECAGAERGDVAALVRSSGLIGALETLRDRGVYVAYEEYLGHTEAVRGSQRFHFGPADFFNPVVAGDYLATSGGSRSKGTPVSVSFAWQRRRGLGGLVRYEVLGVRGARSAIWLPVFPSAAGFSAVMGHAAAGQPVDRWFSQVPRSIDGISPNKQVFNRVLPLLTRAAGLVPPEHVPTSEPGPVLDWLVAALRGDGRAVISGYASSITALAREATARGIDLTGATALPASEPVTSAKLAAIRASGLAAYGSYAFTPEGIVAFQDPTCADEEYVLLEHDLAMIDRLRPLRPGDPTVVPALLMTSLSRESPRIAVNLENDDYGTIRRHVPGDGLLAELGMTTRVAGIRGLSKVVAAGITLDGALFDQLVERVLPDGLGGGAGDYQFVEVDDGGPTRMTLRVHPRVGEVSETRVRELVRGALAGTDNGALADQVWRGIGELRVERQSPRVTPAGKTLSLERIGTGRVASDRSPVTAGEAVPRVA